MWWNKHSRRTNRLRSLSVHIRVPAPGSVGKTSLVHVPISIQGGKMLKFPETFPQGTSGQQWAPYGDCREDDDGMERNNKIGLYEILYEYYTYLSFLWVSMP